MLIDMEPFKNYDAIMKVQYEALDKIDFTARTNASGNFKEILDELNTININDTCETTIISLQLSSILDQVLHKLSKFDQKIYIYRYFYAHSIEVITGLPSLSSKTVIPPA